MTPPCATDISVEASCSDAWRGTFHAMLQQKCSGSDDSILSVHPAGNSLAGRV